MICHFEYNLIIMQTTLKMSRLLWESVISVVIMSFVARGGGGMPIFSTGGSKRANECVMEREMAIKGESLLLPNIFSPTEKSTTHN